MLDRSTSLRAAEKSGGGQGGGPFISSHRSYTPGTGPDRKHVGTEQRLLESHRGNAVSFPTIPETEGTPEEAKEEMYVHGREN